jgi:single-stranded DNA-binding protein
MINEIKIDGRLGSDATPIKKKADDSVIGYRLRLGYNAARGGTGWVDVTVWDATAGELDPRSLTKGVNVMVRGALEQDSWETDGQKRYEQKIVATSIEVI